MMIVVAGVVSVCALWVYLDATANRVGRIPLDHGMLNMSAGKWALGTLLLWVVVFPAYLVKRGALIEKAHTTPIAVKNRVGIAALLGLVGVSWIGLAAASVATGDVPTCDAPEVLTLTQKLFQDTAPGLSLELRMPGQKTYDAVQQKRLCRAMLTAQGEEVAVAYSVEWQDKSKNLIWVQVQAP